MKFEVTGDKLWFVVIPKIPMPKVINEKEENVWPLISASTPSPGEEKGEEDKHVSAWHSLQGNDLRET